MPCLSDSPTDLKVVWVGVGDTKLQIEISLFSMRFGWNPDEGALWNESGGNGLDH